MELTITPDEVFHGDGRLSKLMDELNETFPPFTASPTNSIEDIMFRSGQRSVVEYLLNKLDN